ncbi:MAG: hypothetical protein DRH08_01490 [Deltaproteobacteria bacterium]|nr:MAG: hypothetical protein DRH08_01490 [Deltaproteobacteria bacterium]
MKRLIAVCLVAASLMVVGVGVAGAVTPADYLLTVDGVTYQPNKAVGEGPTFHFNTPDVNPQAAFTDRHVWSGHGSENLPCEGGIHWIDNANVLTISHCLETPPETTTTTEPPTTTTVPETTTTTGPPETTTTQPETSTTTSEPPGTTTTKPTPAETTTTIPEVSTDIPEELPLTGGSLALFAAIGTALLGLGALTLRATRR